jgi:hypothetical protein
MGFDTFYVSFSHQSYQKCGIRAIPEISMNIPSKIGRLRYLLVENNLNHSKTSEISAVSIKM